MNKIKLGTIALLLFSILTSGIAGQENKVETIGLDNINVQGDMQKRILRNFDRMESQRFQPIEGVGCFREAKYSWPGDMEGRTIP